MSVQGGVVTPSRAYDRYTSRQLAVLVPTKDRPGKLRKLLESLDAQSQPVGRIIVIDGGESVLDVVAEFQDRLPVEHHICRPPGQIRQRNMGIARVSGETPLVASLDDDIALEPEAVARMIDFWNRAETETAAVSFNIINEPSEPRSRIKELLGLSAPEPGRVLRSGASTSNCSVSRDVRVEWLCGGATVWRLAVLQEHLHRELSGRWAIAEDLIFSYPIGRQYPLYVCASARVLHEHVFDYRAKSLPRFHGRTRTLWTFYFVEANRELSRTAYLWRMTLITVGKIAVGIVTLNAEPLQFALGQIEGVAAGLKALARGGDVADAIELESKRVP